MLQHVNNENPSKELIYYKSIYLFISTVKFISELPENLQSKIFNNNDSSILFLAVNYYTISVTENFAHNVN